MKHLDTPGVVVAYTMVAASISVLLARRHAGKLSGFAYKQFRLLCFTMIAIVPYHWARLRNGRSKGISIEPPTQNLESVLLPSTTVRV
jgi:hypothetical protein